MCVRFSPLTVEDAQAVLDARGTGRHSIKFIEHPDSIHDVRPGSQVPLFVPDGAGGLREATLEWGFPLDGTSHAVFNTRIESALDQLRRGRRGMWAKAIVEGRCLVPVRSFFEGHITERVPTPATGKPIRHRYRFRLPGAHAFLLTAIQSDGLFSIVTTAPNVRVAPIHDRTPLVLGPGESSVWHSPNFSSITNRDAPALVSEAEL